MAGLSRLVARELSRALGITDNPKYNPAFKKTRDVDFIPAEEDYIEDSADFIDTQALGLTTDMDPNAGMIQDEVTVFYSPALSALEEAPISASGTKGENIEAFVRKRAPKVKQSELSFMGDYLEPTERYTREEAIEAAESQGFTVTANLRTPKYSNEQRQTLEYDPMGYFELTLDYNRNTPSSPVLSTKTHYDPNTIAHTRVSIYDDYEDSFFLVEELQSDLVQNLNKEKAPVEKTTDVVQALLQALFIEAKNADVHNIVIPPVKKLLEARESSLIQGSSKAFENTYNKAVRKAVKRLQAELGSDKVKVGSRELDYEDGVFKGFEINIMDLDDDILDMKPRFNKGGLVQRPN